MHPMRRRQLMDMMGRRQRMMRDRGRRRGRRFRREGRGDLSSLNGMGRARLPSIYGRGGLGEKDPTPVGIALPPQPSGNPFLPEQTTAPIQPYQLQPTAPEYDQFLPEQTAAPIQPYQLQSPSNDIRGGFSGQRLDQPQMNNGGYEDLDQRGNPFSPTGGQGFNLNNMLKRRRNNYYD